MPTTPVKAAQTSPAPIKKTQSERRATAEGKIIEAATLIIAKKGLSGLTLAEAGELAGYSRGIASHHFGKKIDLLIAVINYIASHFNNRLKDKSGVKHGLEMIYAVIDEYFAAVSKDYRITLAFQLVIAEGMTNPTLQPFISEMNHHAIKNLAHHIEQAIEQKEIRMGMNPKNQATMLIASIRGLMAQWLIDKDRINLKGIKKEFIVNLKNSWGIT